MVQSISGHSAATCAVRCCAETHGGTAPSAHLQRDVAQAAACSLQHVLPVPSWRCMAQPAPDVQSPCCYWRQLLSHTLGTALLPAAVLPARLLCRHLVAVVSCARHRYHRYPAASTCCQGACCWAQAGLHAWCHLCIQHPCAALAVAAQVLGHAVGQQSGGLLVLRCQAGGWQGLRLASHLVCLVAAAACAGTQRVWAVSAVAVAAAGGRWCGACEGMAVLRERTLVNLQGTARPGVAASALGDTSVAECAHRTSGCWALLALLQVLACRSQAHQHLAARKAAPPT